MPVVIGSTLPDRSRPATADGTAVADRPLVIGLVNNMPDGAMEATERQFTALLDAAAGSQVLQVHLFAMPGVPRGSQACARIGAAYTAYDALPDTPLDGLIVTGSEPRAASLADEPYWEAFTRLVDWAERHTVSTLWSCLAAHAAVLHLDGVARRRLPAKRSGVYDCAPLTGHPLLSGVAGPVRVCHSRWNDLPESELQEHGYTVLTRSPAAGVDLFVKHWNSLFVFFQGHPEYEPDTLAREYRRDVARFLRGDRPDYPSIPDGYFDEATVAALEATAVIARADPAAVGLRDLPRGLGPRAALAADWGQTALPVFRNWIGLLGARSAARL